MTKKEIASPKKTDLIANKRRRDHAFYKRRRGVLKKAIQLSRLCGQKILMIVYDEQKDKAIQYSSDPSFTVSQAQATVSGILQSDFRTTSSTSRTRTTTTSTVT